MKIPHEWVSEIYNNIIRSCPGSISEAEKAFVTYWYTDFNDAWDIRHPLRFEEFKPFFIKVASWQCNFAIHPMTCGVSSAHHLLLPRLDESGKPYLVCPTCGFVQFYIPI